MIGDAYKSAAAHAVLGAGHSDVIPDVLWLGWLDDTMTLVSMSGLTVAHEVFEGAGDGVTNTSPIDAGVAPATIGDVAFVALFDAATDGAVVVFAPVTFDPTPVEGDDLVFDVTTLTFTVTEP